MKIQIEPTPELDNIKINRNVVPIRVWNGVTASGAGVEVLVLSVVPNSEHDLALFKRELPEFMMPSREVYEIGGLGVASGMIDAIAKALALWAVPFNDWNALTDEQRERWRDAARTAVKAKEQWGRANLTPTGD